MRRRRLERKLFWASIVFALLLIYVVSFVVRLGLRTRDLVIREARFAGLPH